MDTSKSNLDPEDCLTEMALELFAGELVGAAEDFIADRWPGATYDVWEAEEVMSATNRGRVWVDGEQLAADDTKRVQVLDMIAEGAAAVAPERAGLI